VLEAIRQVLQGQVYVSRNMSVALLDVLLDSTLAPARRHGRAHGPRVRGFPVDRAGIVRAPDRPAAELERQDGGTTASTSSRSSRCEPGQSWSAKPSAGPPPAISLTLLSLWLRKNQPQTGYPFSKGCSMLLGYGIQSGASGFQGWNAPVRPVLEVLLLYEDLGTALRAKRSLDRLPGQLGARKGLNTRLWGSICSASPCWRSKRPSRPPRRT